MTDEQKQIDSIWEAITAMEQYIADLEHRHEWWIRNIRQQMSEAGASLARPMPANPEKLR